MSSAAVIDSLPEFNKLFQKSSTRINIPGVNPSDSEDSSDDYNHRNKDKGNDEYVPVCMSTSENTPKYIPDKLSGFEARRPLSPLPSEPTQVTRPQSQSPVHSPPPPTTTTTHDKKSSSKSNIKRRNSNITTSNNRKTTADSKRVKIAANEHTNTITADHKRNQMSIALIEIKNAIIYLVYIPKKNAFDVNLQIPIKYMKNILPIFHKGIKLDIFVQHENSDHIWANVSIKNGDNIKTPVPLYKMVNIDDGIIDNIRIAMNNNMEFKETALNEKSDKNYKIYDECGIICIGDDNSLYTNGRIELKKNITYVFNTSLNIMFGHRYINVQSDKYKCTVCSRDDSNFLICVVITVLDNHTIENGIKLLQYIKFKD